MTLGFGLGGFLVFGCCSSKAIAKQVCLSAFGTCGRDVCFGNELFNVSNNSTEMGVPLNYFGVMPLLTMPASILLTTSVPKTAKIMPEFCQTSSTP